MCIVLNLFAVFVFRPFTGARDAAAFYFSVPSPLFNVYSVGVEKVFVWMRLVRSPGT